MAPQSGRKVLIFSACYHSVRIRTKAPVLTAIDRLSAVRKRHFFVQTEKWPAVDTSQGELIEDSDWGARPPSKCYCRMHWAGLHFGRLWPGTNCGTTAFLLNDTCRLLHISIMCCSQVICTQWTPTHACEPSVFVE